MKWAKNHSSEGNSIRFLATKNNLSDFQYRNNITSTSTYINSFYFYVLLRTFSVSVFVYVWTINAPNSNSNTQCSNGFYQMCAMMVQCHAMCTVKIVKYWKEFRRQKNLSFRKWKTEFHIKLCSPPLPPS